MIAMVGENFDEELLKVGVETALKAGADEAIAKLIDQKKHQIRFSNSSIDVNKEWSSYYLDVLFTKKSRFSLTGKINTLTIQDPDVKKVKKNVPKHVDLLKHLPKNKLYWGMDDGSYTSYRSLDIYDDKIEDFHEKAPELVKKTIDSSLQNGADGVSGVLHSENSKIGVLTSYGNGGIYKSSFCRGTVRAFNGRDSSGQDIVVSRKLSNIDKKFERAGRKAGMLAKRGVGAKEGRAGTYDLIMTPTVAANIFGNLLNGTNPIMMVAGMSPLKGKMNEKIGPDELTVTEDPLIQEGLNSRPFDDEGTPSERTELIKNGEFNSLIHNTSTAKLWKFLGIIKLKFFRRPKTTSNSNLTQLGLTGTEENPRTLMPVPSNYRFNTGSYSLDEFISTSSRPTIYLTSNWYTRFTNMSEGEFSTVPRDAMFLVENGEIKKPIRNLRLKGNLLEILKNIDGIGKDPKQIRWWEVNTPTFIPHIKVKDCKFTKAKGQ